MRKRYRIGRISELMGISSEAIRYYEREGIIEPKKDNNSGYRSYSAWDLHVLIRTRMYRKYGYTLQDTTKALQESDLSALIAGLEEKESALEDSIRHQSHVLEQMHADRRVLADCMTNINKFRLVYSPTMFFIDVQRSYNILDSRVELYRKWIDRVPYAAAGGIFDYPSPGDGKLRYGLVVDVRHIHPDKLEEINNDESNEADVVLIPSQKCLSTFFLSGSDKELCLDMFEPSFNFMRSHGLSLAGSPFARMVHMYRRENGSYTSIYQAWVPYEGESDFCNPLKRDKDEPSEFLDNRYDRNK